MKYPGQPEGAPSWYRDRGASYIEKQFASKLDDLARAIEAERWFGDPEKHSRYRVDFLLKDARLIVELDGHEYHSTKEQLEKDAVRQRYMSRAGYSVIKFTGREVVRDVESCVAEVRTIYEERVQRSPAKYRVMYLDYTFFRRETALALSFYRGLYPGKALAAVSVDDFIPHAIEWLHEKSFVTVFIFHSPDEAAELTHLDGFVKEYEKGEVRMNAVSELLHSVALGEHLASFSHLFDDFYLVADDPVYVAPMRSVLPRDFSEMKMGFYTLNGLANGKLLRKGNEETAFAGTDLAHVQWQDVWYVIGSAMGLLPHEL